MSDLLPYSLALILSEGSFSCVKASRILGFVSHDALTRSLCKTWQYSAVVDWSCLPKEDAVLVIDDTVICKQHSQEIENVLWTWSASENKVVQGISMLLALWVTGETTHVVAVALPGTENRNELAQKLFESLHEAGLQPERVLFDAWYAAAKTLNLLHSLGWTYVSRMKSNRVFNGKPLGDHAFFGAQGQCGKLKGVYHQTQIVKHQDRFLVTNELTPHTSQTLAKLYGQRWVIETVFRALKTTLHLEQCACRNSDAQLSHILSCLEAFSFLKRQFSHLSVEAAQQEMIRQYHSPEGKPNLLQLLRA